jgi:hypothetical protein
MTDFRALLTALTDSGVEFLIVGGAAATAHGAARLTADLDIVYRRTQENCRRPYRLSGIWLHIFEARLPDFLFDGRSRPS